MKVFFTCSARGNPELKENYKRIYNTIVLKGHTQVDNYSDTIDAQKVYVGSHEENLKLYRRAMECIRLADVIVMEVSTHSLSMGYLLQQGLTQGKPVIALYLDKNLPVFAAGIDNEKLQLIEYDSANLEEELSLALENAQMNTDVRFNFFISPEISRFLDWISQVKKIPRSVYLRSLIQRDLESNSQFKEYKDR